MNRDFFVTAGILAVILCTIYMQNVYADLEYDSKFGSAGIDLNEFNRPTDVSIRSNGGLLYVIDSENNRVNVFDDGQHDSDFGSFCSILSIQSCNDNASGANENGDGQFDRPTRGMLDLYGNFFVVDSDNHRVQRFDDNGRFEIKFGSANSTASGYLGSPNGIATLTSTRDVYVSDTVTDSVNVFDSSGDFLFSFDSYDGNNFVNPSYLAIDSTDEILYVSDSGHNQIAIFRLVEGSTCPAATEKVTDGVCFVEKFGSSGSGNGEFDTPMGLALDTSNNLLYVADTDNDRIQVLSVSVDSLTFIPNPPDNPVVSPISPTSVLVTWDEPILSKDIPKITGYKIEYKKDSGDFKVITNNTKNTVTSFVHDKLSSESVYRYRVYSINSVGISAPSSTYGVQPQQTTVPSGLIADDISPTQIKLTWYPPTNTFGQPLSGYEVKRVLSTGVYDPVGQTDSSTTSFVVNDLETDKTYSFVVTAKIGFGFSNESQQASATPRDDSSSDQDSGSFTADSVTVPSAPLKLVATSISSTQINLSWNAPTTDGNSEIRGYSIDVKKDSGSFITLVANTKNTDTTYKHTGLSQNSQYTYRVFAINSEGTSDASNQSSASPVDNSFQISPIGKFTIDEGQTLSFSVKIADGTTSDVVYSLGTNVPSGVKINPTTGLFSWTPTGTQGAKSYTFDIVAKRNSMTDRQSVTITVNDVIKDQLTDTNTKPSDTLPTQDKPKEPVIPAPFVDETKDPQSYVDRYNDEASYKKWFDDNYPQYSSIYEAVGLTEPPEIPAPFVDVKKDPYYYVSRYNIDSTYKKWFDDNYPDYSSIAQAVGYDESKKSQKEYGFCGTGTKLIDDVCTIIDAPKSTPWWKFW